MAATCRSAYGGDAYGGSAYGRSAYGGMYGVGGRRSDGGGVRSVLLLDCLPGPTWTYLDLLGPTWTYLDLPGPTWTSYLDLLGPTWAYLDLLGPTWTYLDPTWTCPYTHIRTRAHEHTRTHARMHACIHTDLRSDLLLDCLLHRVRHIRVKLDRGDLNGNVGGCRGFRAVGDARTKHW